MRSRPTVVLLLAAALLPMALGAHTAHAAGGSMVTACPGTGTGVLLAAAVAVLLAGGMLLTLRRLRRWRWR
ncbi:hypothetical protein ACIQF6_18835 [Kitasatospora sp. NPDC092948]|uniref:hypothetical protein n=1 Tax=Kitasatospora sp. NPDC092948 TaxID=3364088 RepID=UPI0038024C86